MRQKLARNGARRLHDTPDSAHGRALQTRGLRHVDTCLNPRSAVIVPARRQRPELLRPSDPFHIKPGEFNNHDGGGGLYWDDPDGHVLEILTVPYGGGDNVS